MTPWGKKRTFGRAEDARECETGRQWPNQRSKPWQRPDIAPPSPHQVLERLNPVPGTHAARPLEGVCRGHESPCPAQRKAMAGVLQDLAGSEARQAGGEGLVTDEREELASSAGREREGTVLTPQTVLYGLR